MCSVPRACCLPACEDTMLSDQPYRYLTVDEMKSLGDDSLPIDVTRDERIDSNKEATAAAPPTAVDDTASPQHAKESYAQYAANYTPDNVELARHPVHVGFLVSFLVDARGGAMRGCRHSGVRVIVPPRKAAMPTRVTCRYLKRDKLTHPPPLMEGEALASRILELGPVGAKFLGPVIIEVPHFGSLRGAEREIVVLRSDNGETWREHSAEASEDAVRDVLHESFEGEELAALEEAAPGRTTRILTSDFPQYFAIVSRVRQEVHAIGPEGGMVSSSVVPQVQAVFPQGALTKKIKVGLQAQPIPAELTAKLLGNRVAVSPIVTVEPRRRKFHKPITLTIPVPQAANKGMINQYSGDAPTLRLLCSITGGTTRAQWEDVTGSTPLTFVNDCVSFTTTVSARFWLMDCRNIAEATKMATELYKEAIHVPFMAKFVVFAKRVDALEARLRVFCMTDDKEDKTLEQQEHFTEVAKSRDVEVLEGKPQYIEFAGNLVPVTKSGDQLQLGFRAFRENRLPFTVRVKDPHADTVGRVLFMREPKVPKGEPPQQPVCILNIVLPETIVPESGVSEPDLLALQSKYRFLRDGVGRPEAFSRASLRLADISNLLGDDWVPLALQLGLTTSDVNVIKSQQPGGGAHQAMAMLRLWLRTAGNKATSNTLEVALRKVGRDDVVQQCIFNTEEVERAVARVRADQAGFDALKEEIGPSRDASLRRDAALDAAFEEQDIMKESESVEELVQAEKKEPRKEERLGGAAPGLAARAALEALVADKLPPDVVDERERDETKYIGEEKTVVEEERRTVAQLKEIFAQDKRDRQYERQPRPQAQTGGAVASDQEDSPRPPSTAEDASSRPSSSTLEDTTTDEDTARPRVPAPVPAVKTTAAADAERRDSALFEGVSQELARLDTTYKVTPAPETVLSPKVSKTPPPSPAEFKETAGAPAWQPGAIPPPGTGAAPPECTVRPCADEETVRLEPSISTVATKILSSIQTHPNNVSNITCSSATAAFNYVLPINPNTPPANFELYSPRNLPRTVSPLHCPHNTFCVPRLSALPPASPPLGRSLTPKPPPSPPLGRSLTPKPPPSPPLGRSLAPMLPPSPRLLSRGPLGRPPPSPPSVRTRGSAPFRGLGSGGSGCAEVRLLVRTNDAGKHAVEMRSALLSSDPGHPAPTEILTNIIPLSLSPTRSPPESLRRLLVRASPYLPSPPRSPSTTPSPPSPTSSSAPSSPELANIMPPCRSPLPPPTASRASSNLPPPWYQQTEYVAGTPGDTYCSWGPAAEDEDDATLLPLEAGSAAARSATTTTTTTTVRDVDGNVVTTVTRMTEQRSDSSGGARPQ